MLERGKSSDAPEARAIYGDMGTYVLAADEHAAREFAEDQGLELAEDVGWMHETGWDQDDYESREEFDEHSGFTTWWTACRVPEGTIVREGLMRAWSASYA